MGRSNTTLEEALAQPAAVEVADDAGVTHSAVAPSGTRRVVADITAQLSDKSLIIADGPSPL